MTKLAKDLSILIVDDNASMRSALRSIVKGDGYQVAGDAGDGKTALALALQLKPDVVLLDLSIPVVSALDLMSQLKSAKVDCAVVVVSASDTHSDLKKAFELDAVGSVSKPLNADKILKTLDQVGFIKRAKQGNVSRQGSESSAVKCIIVDKDPAVRGLLKALVSTENVKVVMESDNGLQSLVDIETHKPDLVFLDVDLPEVNGLNILRCARAVHPEIKVIMATARSEGEVVKEALAQGVAGYLLKPVDPAKVLSTLRKALGRA